MDSAWRWDHLFSNCGLLWWWSRFLPWKNINVHPSFPLQQEQLQENCIDVSSPFKIHSNSKMRFFSLWKRWPPIQLRTGVLWPQKLPSCHWGASGNLTMTRIRCSWTTSPICPGAAFPHPYDGRTPFRTRTFNPTWRLSVAKRSSDARPRHLSELGKQTRSSSSSIAITSPTSPSTSARRYCGSISSRTLTWSPTTKPPTWRSVG